MVKVSARLSQFIFIFYIFIRLPGCAETTVNFSATGSLKQ
ncbi:hypothetical protein UYSO10_1378 [Kosakonia radicincitans]|nr:hypothetical protein UYSO10_1378 [Kosakonia radicincitans]